MHSAEQVADILIQGFESRGMKRARVSEVTIRELSSRTILRASFVSALKSAMDDRGYGFMEGERGYYIIRVSLLDGAPVLSLEDVKPKRKTK